MENITYEWLQGFSSRASQLHKASRSIFITSTDQELLRTIFTFLVYNKFRARWSNLGTRYGIRISGKESLLLWKENIGFASKEKATQLDELISMYNK